MLSISTTRNMDEQLAKDYPEMASPYADALPDLAGPGRRALLQGATQKQRIQSPIGTKTKAQCHVIKHHFNSLERSTIEAENAVLGSNLCQNQDAGSWKVGIFTVIHAYQSAQVARES